MIRVVVDTDVISGLYQETPEAEKFRQYLQKTVPTVPFISLAELHFGALANNWDDKAVRDLNRYLRQYRVVPYSNRLPQLFAQLRAQAIRTGHPLGEPKLTNDLWVAASAVHSGAPLLTNNVDRFRDFPGITVLN